MVRPRSEAGDDHARDGEGDDRPDGQGEEDQAQGARVQAEGVAHLRDA